MCLLQRSSCALEATSQIMEGVTFLHNHLVAHRDLFISNFLRSRRNGKYNVSTEKDFLRPRYCIIDFEWAVRFLSSSNPVSRTVVGPPTRWDDYRRPAPPEMRSSQPYCPFKADVWQLGCTFLFCFQVLHLASWRDNPRNHTALRFMNADSPDARPTARAAVERLNRLRTAIPSNILRQSIDEPEWSLPED
ncbi:hypothetical protein EW146_g1250 [Bondarzewia mesenterica]|uniref:non-specific serine/threonine protein kinase n=1 Tax=Bondarzewia mesenterica TaxID=1095465 RepID=A0A4S4M6E7_9AGAM|nr:hypothetical protein EW146_g1250 [Bondarzewia mesenterica]